MGRTARINIALAATSACAVVLAGVTPAHAADPSVTIAASKSNLTFGASVVVSGKIAPASSGQEVVIVDADGRTRGRDDTDDRGRYSVELRPRHTMKLHAEWTSVGGTVKSTRVVVRVRPRLRLRLSRVRLFDRALARGRLRPGHAGRRIDVRLFRNGVRVAQRRVRLRPGGYFRSRFFVGKPGSYRARAFFDDDDHLPARAATRIAATPLPYLNVGSRSIYVKLLERRLGSLHYRIAGVNRNYDRRTADAMRAFNKVQRRTRVGSVDRATWYALASPRRPRPRFRLPRYHVEVDQTKQVLYRVRRGRIVTIMHVSTGAGGATRDGTFTFYREVNGYSPNRLYYPYYFDGLRAVHGWPQVPTYPASHGCVRVPMWTARWINSQITTGMKIHIYH